MNLPTASEAIGHVRRRWRWRLDRRVGFTLLACFFAVGIGIAAYRIGKLDGIEAPQGEAIQRQAFQTWFDLARTDAAARAKRSGRRAGHRAGQLAGERAGARLGERRGSAAVERVQAAIAEQQAIGGRPGRRCRATKVRADGGGGSDHPCAHADTSTAAPATCTGARSSARTAGTRATLLRCGWTPLLSDATASARAAPRCRR